MHRRLLLALLAMVVVLTGCAPSLPDGGGGSARDGGTRRRDAGRSAADDPDDDGDDDDDDDERDAGRRVRDAGVPRDDEDPGDDDPGDDDPGDDDPGDDDPGDDDPGDDDPGDDDPIDEDGSGESCDDVAPLAISSGRGSASGSTTGFAHDEGGPDSCGECRTRVDVVYGFDVPPNSRVVARYTGDGGSLDCISLQNACPQSLIGGYTCGDPRSELETAPREFPTGGRAYVFVWTDEEKDYDLEVEIETM